MTLNDLLVEYSSSVLAAAVRLQILFFVGKRTCLYRSGARASGGRATSAYVTTVLFCVAYVFVPHVSHLRT